MNVRKKNGYLKLPTEDPDEERDEARKFNLTNGEPREIKPGLFVKFSKERHKMPSESEEIEMTDLKRKRPKHRKPKSPSSKKPRQQIIEEPLLSGDTIQRVSLRYACPVAELRRINKLYSDVDFHALKSIKIPVKEYSLLTDENEREKRRNLVVEDNNKSGSSGNSTDDRYFGGPESYYNSELSEDADDEGDEESDETPEYRDISIQSALRWKHTNQSLLEKLDKSLEKVKNSNETHNVREIRLTFETPSIHPVSAPELYTKSLFEIPDWRILLLTGVGIIIVIAIGAAVTCIKGYCPFNV